MKKAYVIPLLFSKVFAGVVGSLLSTGKDLASIGAAAFFNPQILLGDSYESSGGPSSGYLYNYGTHGFVSKPSGLFSPLSLLNIVGIGRSEKSRIPISLYKARAGSLGYGLKINAEATEQNIFGDDIGKSKILGVNKFTRMLVKRKIKNNDDVDLFNIVMDVMYPKYFRIIYYGMCATPLGAKSIIFSQCLSPDNPAFINQLFKISSDIKSEAIFVPKGISPYYFEGEAPCTRDIPDTNRGQFFLLNQNYCDNNCVETKPQSNPAEYIPEKLI